MTVGSCERKRAETDMSNEEIKSTLALVMRSPDRGDGWRTVSGACWPLVETMPPELIDLEPGDEGGRVRMTDEGRAVIAYA